MKMGWSRGWKRRRCCSYFLGRCCIARSRCNCSSGHWSMLITYCYVYTLYDNDNHVKYLER